MTKFPTKLHRLLNQALHDPLLSQIISWLPSGEAFKIHDPFLLSEVVLPRHFTGMNSFKSFRRQLNLYGIKKLLKSHVVGKQTSTYTPAKLSEAEKKELIGAYYHPMFRKDKMELTAGMTRTPKNVFCKRSCREFVRPPLSSRNSTKKWMECASISLSGAHAEDGGAMNLVMGSPSLSPREELRALLSEETKEQGLAWRSPRNAACYHEVERVTTNFVLDDVERLLKSEGYFSESDNEDEKSCSQRPQSPKSFQEEIADKKTCINHDNDLLFMCSSDDSFDYDDIRREIIKTFLAVH